MKIVKQKNEIPVKNYDEIANYFSGVPNEIRRHGPMFPQNMLSIFSGASSSGKTNALLSIICHPQALRFESIRLFSRSADQPKYKYLKHLLSGIKEIKFEISTDENIPDLSTLASYTLIVLDDISFDTQKSIQKYFQMVRHKNCDIILIAQSYSKICKQLIRDNSNFLVFFPQDDRNLELIFRDHCPDISLPVFKKICIEAWKEPFSFLVIDKQRSMNDGKYRRGFDSIIIPE